MIILVIINGVDLLLRKGSTLRYYFLVAVYFSFIVYLIYGFFQGINYQVKLDEDGIWYGYGKKQIGRIYWLSISSVEWCEPTRLAKNAFSIHHGMQVSGFSDWYTDYIELGERIIAECQKRNPNVEIDPKLIDELHRLKMMQK